MASTPDTHYSPQTTTERLLATSRVILAGFFLLAIWLDPSEPSLYAPLTYAILAGYLGYALLLAVLGRYRLSSGSGTQLASHAVDMLVFAILVFLTQGPNSPFFVYFVFLLVCGTLRWQWRGTLWTAGVALAITVALTWYPTNLLRPEGLELNRFIIRFAYLAVIAMLLGYLGAHEAKLRRLLSRLAASPPAAPAEFLTLARETLDYAAQVFETPRTVLLWEEPDEPWLHLAFWSHGEFRYSREHPSAFGDIIAEPVASTRFLCQNLQGATPEVIHTSADGLKRWQGVPLTGRLQERLAAGAVLSARWEGENLTGYLLVLDKPRMNADDLMLAEIVAQGIATRFDHVFFLQQLQQAAAAEERIKMARDLHDGLLQSLTGAALQLESVYRLLENGPPTAQQRIREIQRLIAAEQGDLRAQISELRPFLAHLAPEDFALDARLEELAERIRRQWDLSVRIDFPPSGPRINKRMAREIYFVIHEALINAVRHAGASTLHANLGFAGNRVEVTITDDGSGFSFRGRYDQDELLALKRGPVTLRERIAALRGTLAIDSQATGARLEISLPLTEYGG